jgi:hypothetical protein
VKATFCEDAIPMLVNIDTALSIIFDALIFTGIGYFTSIVQKLVVIKNKDNVDPQIGRMILEGAILATIISTYVAMGQRPQNSLIYDNCS